MVKNLHLPNAVGVAPPPIVVPGGLQAEQAEKRPGVSVLFDAVSFEKHGDQYVLLGAIGEEIVRLDARHVLKCRRTGGASR